MRRDESGFTLIEVVTVIVILGVLAAVLLPKFLNLRSDAEESSVKGTMAAFSSAITSVHAYWVLKGNGQTGILPVPGVGNMRFNAAGYPLPYDPATGIGGDLGCSGLMRQVLTPAPTVNHIDLPNHDWYSDVGGSACDYMYNRSGSALKCQSGFNYESTTGAVTFVQYPPGAFGSCTP